MGPICINNSSSCKGQLELSQGADERRRPSSTCFLKTDRTELTESISVAFLHVVLKYDTMSISI